MKSRPSEPGTAGRGFGRIGALPRPRSMMSPWSGGPRFVKLGHGAADGRPGRIAWSWPISCPTRNQRVVRSSPTRPTSRKSVPGAWAAPRVLHGERLLRASAADVPASSQCLLDAQTADSFSCRGGAAFRVSDLAGRSDPRRGRGSTALALQPFFTADTSTQRTPSLPSWSAITVSEGALLPSTTVPPTARTAAIRGSAASGAT
jgi:hypothetical protein